MDKQTDDKLEEIFTRLAMYKYAGGMPYQTVARAWKRYEEDISFLLTIGYASRFLDKYPIEKIDTQLVKMLSNCRQCFVVGNGCPVIGEEVIAFLDTDGVCSW